MLVEDPLSGRELSMALPMSRWKIWTYRISFIVLLVSLVIAMAVSATKYAIQSQEQDWVDLLLARPAYLCLPLLFISSRWIFHLLHCIGNAIVLTVFYKLQKMPEEAAVQQKEGQ